MTRRPFVKHTLLVDETTQCYVRCRLNAKDAIIDTCVDRGTIHILSFANLKKEPISF
jgi:hypothetical protein